MLRHLWPPFAGAFSLACRRQCHQRAKAQRLLPIFALMKTLCIGFLGADWWGSDARAMAAELRRGGHVVLERHYEDFFPTKWRHPILKAVRRLLRRVMAKDYNRAVAELLEVDAMDFLLVFKGMLLAPETLARFKAKGIPCYCF